MSKVRDILRLYTKGVNKTEISVRAGISRNTVKKYIRDFISMSITQEDIEKMSDIELESLFRPEEKEREDQRYQDVMKYFPIMEKALKQTGMTRHKQWEIYKATHSEFYCRAHFLLLYSKWSSCHKTIMHIDHKSGDKMYVDYAGDKLEYFNLLTNAVCPVEVFVSILGASQLVYVEASMSQKKEDFIASCENALRYYGGSPQAIVTDNLKSAVIKSDKYEPTLNELFKDFAEHYSMTVLPAKPYRPTYKALVEGMVKIIYRTIYISVRSKKHFSLSELNESIWASLDILNNKNFSGRPYSRRQLFEELEKNELQALPEFRYEARRKYIVKVQKNNYVLLAEDKHYYSVPYKYIGQRACILYNETKVDIYVGYMLVANHQRDRGAYRYTTIDDHLASKHRFLSDWHPERFISMASEVGEYTKEYIINIFELKQHPEQAYKSCQGILVFASKVGKQRLENACKRALHYNEYSYHTIRTIIEKGLDNAAIDSESEHRIIPPHVNIRGKSYYE